MIAKPYAFPFRASPSASAAIFLSLHERGEQLLAPPEPQQRWKKSGAISGDNTTRMGGATECTLMRFRGIVVYDNPSQL